MDINIKVTVDLSDRAANLLRQFAPDLPDEVCRCSAHPDLKTEVEEIVVDFLGRLKKHAEKPVEEPKPETVQSPTPAEKAAPAPQQAPAAPAQKEISDADLRLAVKAAKDKVGTDGVKALFHEFEIPNSSACPQERRSELMDRLNKLAA
jgi:hypothetical protein